MEKGKKIVMARHYWRDHKSIFYFEDGSKEIRYWQDEQNICSEVSYDISLRDFSSVLKRGNRQL